MGLLRSIKQNYIRSIIYDNDDAPAFTPNSLTGLSFWLDLDDSSKVTADAYNTEITGLTEKSSSARTFVNLPTPVPAVWARRPMWNNRRVMAVSLNANCGMQSSAQFNVDTLFEAVTFNITIFVVYGTLEPTITFGNVFYHLVSGGNGTYFRINQSAGNTRFLASGTTTLNQANTNYVGERKIVTLQRQAGNLRAFINGVQSGTDQASVAALAGGNATFFLGCSSTSGGGFAGDIAEIIMYARALNATDRVKVEDYLAAKWIPGAVIT